jgi:hypothetical protein
MSHSVTEEHLRAGCKTCTGRVAAAAVRTFTKSLRQTSITREARVLDAKADELETGKARLACSTCNETEERPDSSHCRKCGGQLIRADEVDQDLPGTDAREWSGANNRRLRQAEDEDARKGAQRANEAVRVFRQSADLDQPQGKGAAAAIAAFKKSANVRG